MSLETDLFDKIARVIRAQETLEVCQTIQEMLACAFEFDNYLVIAYRGEESPVVIYRSGTSESVHAELDSHYVSSLYVLDPFYSAHRTRIDSGCYRLRDLAPDKFTTTSYFMQYYKKTTLLDELAYFAYSTDGWTFCICVGRDENSGKPFAKSSIKKAMELAPVVVSILETRWQKAPFELTAAEENIPSLVQNLIDSLVKKHRIQITHRQAEVALHLLRGHSSRSIGMEMNISWHTVRVFRKQLYNRCSISSQAELFSLLLPLGEMAHHQT